MYCLMGTVVGVRSFGSVFAWLGLCSMATLSRMNDGLGVTNDGCVDLV